MTHVPIETLISSIIWEAASRIISLTNDPLGVAIHPEGLTEEEVVEIQHKQEFETTTLFNSLLEAFAEYEADNLEDAFCDYDILIQERTERLDELVTNLVNSTELPY